MDKIFDIVGVGNAVIDAFLSIDETTEHCRFDPNTSELCLKYGEKIPVNDCRFLTGGNTCNVIVGLSRLGLKTAFAVELGDDYFAEKIINDLKKEKVDLTFVRQIKGKETSISIAINFKEDKIIFTNHVLRKHDLILDGAKTRWVFLSSIGREWQKAYQNVFNFVKNNNVKLAFNPGSRQIKEGMESFKEIVKAAEIIFVNKQEVQHLISDENENEIKNLLLKVKNLGAKIVVITDAANGSFVLDENGKMFKIGIFPANVVQKTGAGDAYTCGFLGAMILDLPVAEAMRWGAVNAAGVIQKIGAQTGLLTKEEIENKLKENSKFQAREI